MQPHTHVQVHLSGLGHGPAANTGRAWGWGPVVCSLRARSTGQREHAGGGSPDLVSLTPELWALVGRGHSKLAPPCSLGHWPSHKASHLPYPPPHPEQQQKRNEPRTLIQDPNPALGTTDLIRGVRACLLARGQRESPGEHRTGSQEPWERSRFDPEFPERVGCRPSLWGGARLHKPAPNNRGTLWVANCISQLKGENKTKHADAEIRLQGQCTCAPLPQALVSLGSSPG